MSIIVIPAEVVTILRSALIGEMGEPLDALCQATLAADREKHPEWFKGPLAELDRYRAALDALGWGEPEEEQPISLDLDAYRQQVVKALRSQLVVEHSFMADSAGKKDPGSQHEYSFAASNARIIEAFVTIHGLADAN